MKLKAAEREEKSQRQEQEQKQQEKRRKYVSIYSGTFRPSRGRVLAENHQVPKSNSWTYTVRTCVFLCFCLTPQEACVVFCLLQFWVRPDGLQGSWANIIHKGAQNIERNPAVWFYPGSLRLHIRSGTGTSWHTGANTGADPTDVLVSGKWTHVAFSHTNGALRVCLLIQLNGLLILFTNNCFEQVYLDGVQKSYAHLRAPNHNNGALWGSDPWHHAGKCHISDMRIYRRVLGPSEIQAVKKEGKH